MSRAEYLLLTIAAVCLIAAAGYYGYSRSHSSPEQTRPESGYPSTAVPAQEIASVTHAAFSDGRWYLADARGSSVHLVDSSGKYLRSYGRRGAGPGEFRNPSMIASSAGFIFVADRSRPEIGILDGEGKFIRSISAAHGCTAGVVAGLAAVESGVYVLRRCLDQQRRLRYQVEHSNAAGVTTVWLPLADTVSLASGAVPIHFPIFAANRDRVIIGNGESGCLRVYRQSDGNLEGERCLHELPRTPLPKAEQQRLHSRWRGRVTIPDSLPRIRGLFLSDTLIVVQTAVSVDSSTWFEFNWSDMRSSGWVVSAAKGYDSFFSRSGTLVVHEEADGIRLQIIHAPR